MKEKTYNTNINEAFANGEKMEIHYLMNVLQMTNPMEYEVTYPTIHKYKCYLNSIVKDFLPQTIVFTSLGLGKFIADY